MADDKVNDVSDTETVIENGNSASGTTITEADLEFLNTFMNLREIKVTTEYVTPQEFLVENLKPVGEDYKIETTAQTTTVGTTGFAQVTRNWDINDIEEILELASLMEFQIAPVYCPISACSAYVSSLTVLGHLLKCHANVVCQEVKYRDVATCKVHLNKFILGETYCAGILAYCGTDSMGPHRPGSGGLCYQNMDMPDMFERIECHLPIFVMVCMISINALFDIESNGPEEPDSKEAQENDEILSMHDTKQSVEEANESTDPKSDINYNLSNNSDELTGPNEEETKIPDDFESNQCNEKGDAKKLVDLDLPEATLETADDSDTVLLVWLSTVETARPVHCLLNVFTEQSTGANVRGVIAHCLKDGSDPRKFSRAQPDWICLSPKEQADLIAGSDSTLVNIEAMITSY